MLNMPADMVAMMEKEGALMRPPDVEKIVAASTAAVVGSMEKASCALCDIACKVEAAANEVRAAGAAQAAAFDGWMGFPVVSAPEWPFNTFSGPGKLDPYSDPFRWQHHREDDEIMAIISAFLSVN